MPETNRNGSPYGFDNPMFKPFMDMWTSYSEQTSQNTERMMHGFSDGMNPADAYEKFRGQWMDSMGQSIDAFMRSPIFLQWMRHNSDAVTKSKEQVNNFSQEVARNCSIPTVDDISGLFERLHSAEETILLRLNQLHSRLDRMEATLDGLVPGKAESGSGSGAGPSRSRAKPKKKAATKSASTKRARARKS
tara:strand:+ start:611 stop:1183 length:573 start_codon:yes stop_codon:yes gene_type:complete